VSAPIPPVVSVRGLSIQFLGAPAKAVSNVSFDIAQGEIYGIVGESGSGKSVIAMSLAGLLPRTSCKVTADRLEATGHNLLTATKAELTRLRGKKVSFIFQEPMSALNPSRRVQDLLVEVIVRHQGLSRRDADAEAVRLLDRTRIQDPERVLKAFPFELSGGMRQRVLIAMAFAGAPELLIADEPTTALDVTVQREIVGLLRDLAAERGSSILFISHDLGLVGSLCDRILVLARGEVVECGNAREVLRAPQHPYTRMLIAARPELHTPRSMIKMSLAEGSPSVKHDSPDAPEVSAASATDGQRVLTVRNLTVKFPVQASSPHGAKQTFTAVNDISFDLREGRTLAVIGESGSGKTSIARVVSGLQKKAAGEVRIWEQPIETMPAGKVQLVFQDPQGSFNPRMPIWALVTEPVSQLAKDERRIRAAALLERVGLAGANLDGFANAFSGGQRQRLAIARALSSDPGLLILDEPTSALDLSVQAQILNLLLELQNERSMAFLLITHDISVVRHMSDELIVLQNGELMERGVTSEVLKAPASPYTRTLLASVPRLPD
jgi:peptide/nickel transport system ATP-binding protein